MKIVALVSSPHVNGNGAALVNEVILGAESAGASVTKINLAQYKIGYCNGCNRCMAEGRCWIPDDFEALRKALYEADGIIVESPTYCGSINAVMKTFVERLGMFERCTSSLGGKYVAAIATCSGSGAKKVVQDLAALFTGGFFERGYISGRLVVALPGGKKAMDNKKAVKDAQRLGIKLANDIKQAKRYPFQNLMGRMVGSLFLRPVFIKFITAMKDKETKAVYENLYQRGLIQ